MLDFMTVNHLKNSNQVSKLIVAFFLLALNDILFYVSRCFACMSVCPPHACLMPTEVRGRYWDSCDLSCGCQESNVGPLEEQTMVLTWVISPTQLEIFLTFKKYKYLFKFMTRVWRDTKVLIHTYWGDELMQVLQK